MKIFFFLFLFSISYSCLYSQDIDNDNINDELEQLLAEKFAPEWRFNKHKENDSSNQNDNEEFYPCSPEWLQSRASQLGEPLKISINGIESKITDVKKLCNFTDPATGKSVCSSTISWSDSRYKLTYPKKIHGDPDGFPTYFNCRLLGTNLIKITYFLFYPYDFKVDNLVNNWWSNHRGDWVGLSVILKPMIDDFTFFNLDVVKKAEADYVMFGGHGPRRYLYTNSPDYMHEGDHPQAFITWGSHGIFPQPGEFHDYNEIICSSVDDYFRGNGLIVQSWNKSRRLLNLGEKNLPHPDRSWITFKGLWGNEDRDQGSSSPGSPPSKATWNSTKNSDNWYIWENLKQNNMNGKWCGDVKVFDEIPSNGCKGWNSHVGPIAIFWDDGSCNNCDTWDGEYNLFAGPSEFPDASIIQGRNLQSAMLLGEVKVYLYDQINFKGNLKVLNSSVPKFDFPVKSLRIVDNNKNYLCGTVVSKTSIYNNENGTWIKPYKKIINGVQNLASGDCLCIKNEIYNEKAIIINKRMTIKAIGGPVIIGKE